MHCVSASVSAYSTYMTRPCVPVCLSLCFCLCLSMPLFLSLALSLSPTPAWVVKRNIMKHYKNHKNHHDIYASGRRKLAAAEEEEERERCAENSKICKVTDETWQNRKQKKENNVQNTHKRRSKLLAFHKYRRGFSMLFQHCLRVIKTWAEVWVQYAKM